MTIVYITGMHRSGTSMVAKRFNICGLYLVRDEEGRCGADPGYSAVGGLQQPKVVNLAEPFRAVTCLKNQYETCDQHAYQAMQMNRFSYRHVASKEPLDET